MSEVLPGAGVPLALSALGDQRCVSAVSAGPAMREVQLFCERPPPPPLGARSHLTMCLYSAWGEKPLDLVPVVIQVEGVD